MSLELFWNSLLRDKRYKLFLPLLYILSLGFKACLKLRHFLYDQKILKTLAVDACVISVGSILVGGAGKTPFTLWLVKQLEKKTKVAVLTRGYRSQLENAKISQEAHPFVLKKEAWKIVGDEPLLLCNHLDVDVWVGKNRRSSALQAAEKGAKVLVLDDGMQTRSLKKDYEIVLLDGNAPLSEDFLLPRGHLREIPSRLSIADLIVFVGGATCDWGKTQKEIARFTSAPCMGMVAEITVPKNCNKVGVFCGLARPERFLQSLRKKGVEVVETLFLGDHQEISKGELEEFARKAKAKGAVALLCTEKDGVKIPPDAQTQELPIFHVPLELKILYNTEVWEKFLENLCAKSWE